MNFTNMRILSSTSQISCGVKKKEKFNVNLDWSLLDKVIPYSPASKNECYALQRNITFFSQQRVCRINSIMQIITIIACFNYFSKSNIKSYFSK